MFTEVYVLTGGGPAGSTDVWIPNNPSMVNFEAAGEHRIWDYLVNSLIIAGGALLLILTTMMLPEEVIAIPLSLVIGDLPLVHISLKGTLLGVILPLGAWGFSIFVMTEFMKEIPMELEEAAKVDGAGELRIFAQIVLPLIVAADPSDHTLTVALLSLRSDDQVGPGIVLAGALLALVPSLLVYLSLQKSFLRGITTGAIKG